MELETAEAKTTLNEQINPRDLFVERMRRKLIEQAIEEKVSTPTMMLDRIKWVDTDMIEILLGLPKSKLPEVTFRVGWSDKTCKKYNSDREKMIAEKVEPDAIAVIGPINEYVKDW